MQYGTPVITYNNTSITEIAGDAVLYARDYATIKDAIEKLLDSKDLVKKYAQTGQRHAQRFSWAKTVETILRTTNS
jgi:glycosyltransferase involved in cell wall biosynthesis